MNPAVRRGKGHGLMEAHACQTWNFSTTAHGGSSSQGLCISHTGVVGAPYSGRTRPGHPASPGGAGNFKRKQ